MSASFFVLVLASVLFEKNETQCSSLEGDYNIGKLS